MKRPSERVQPGLHRGEAPVSERERRFVEAFMGAAQGNATEAARRAGYGRKSAHVTASRLLKKAKIRHAIEARVKADPAVAAREELQRFFTAIIRGCGTYVLLRMRDRLKAAELLGRSHKMFTDRHEVEAGDNLRALLEQAGLARSQGPR